MYKDKKPYIKYLNRYKYEKLRGEIPKGYAIHHKDKNPANNKISNLECISITEHCKSHLAERTKQQKDKCTEVLNANRHKAAEWHRSDEGRKWHSEHSKRIAKNRKYIWAKCSVCGCEYKTTTQRANRKYICSEKFIFY